MNPNAMVGSIIIPAWNEVAVIQRTLVHLFDGLIDEGARTPHVVVACNGCTDGTPEVVRRLGLDVTVLDLPAVGKPGSIRAAEAVTSELPRLYLDADVELHGHSARLVLDALSAGAVAARPPLIYDLDGASHIVQMFYSVRSRLVGPSGDLCGAGVYGLSAEARARFGCFPDVVADDLFAAWIVEQQEVTIVDCDPVRVRVPRTARHLVRTLARTNRGNRELAAAYPLLARQTATTTVACLASQVRDVRTLGEVGVYAALVASGRALSRLPSRGWARDESSREAHES